MSAATKQDDTAYRGPAPREGPAKKEAPTAWHRATYRWTAITTVAAVLLVIYTQHPYYGNQQFAPWRTAYPIGFVLWLVFGLYYCKATLEKFSDRRYVMRDGALHLLILAKRGFEDVLTAGQWRRVGVLAATAAIFGVLRSTSPKTSFWHGDFASGVRFNSDSKSRRRFWRSARGIFSVSSIARMFCSTVRPRKIDGSCGR